MAVNDILKSISDACERAMKDSLRAPTSEDLEQYTTPPRWALIERIHELANTKPLPLVEPRGCPTPGACSCLDHASEQRLFMRCVCAAEHDGVHLFATRDMPSARGGPNVPRCVVYSRHEENFARVSEEAELAAALKGAAIKATLDQAHALIDAWDAWEAAVPREFLGTEFELIASCIDALRERMEKVPP